MNTIRHSSLKFLFCVLLLSLSCSLMLANKPQTVKKVSVLGDSYSTYKGWVTPDSNWVWYRPINPRNDVNDVNQMWWKIFIDRHHYKLEINNSFSGTTICNTGYGRHDYSQKAFIARTATLGHPDIIFVFGGTNDDWADSPKGEYKYNDWTKEELYYFRPAMAKMLSDLKRLYPKAEIYFLLNSDMKASTDESCITICKHYGIPLIKLVKIDKQEGHPSQKGMKQIADQIDAFLQKNKPTVSR